MSLLPGQLLLAPDCPLRASPATTHEQTGKSLSLYQQQETFSLLKEQRPSLKSVHSQVTAECGRTD